MSFHQGDGTPRERVRLVVELDNGVLDSAELNRWVHELALDVEPDLNNGEIVARQYWEIV